MIRKFNYDLVKYVVPNYKLKKDTSVVLIADMHNYISNEFKRDNLCKVIKELNPHHIMIAGDNMQGDEWENSKCINNLKYFLDNLREVSPIFISLGNHDLLGNNKKNHNVRICNFKNLEKENIYPLHEEKIIYDNFEIIGITPSIELVNDSFFISQELLHQRYLEEIKNKIIIDENYIVEFLGHDPHMIVGDNLGLLKKCDYFYCGHLHGGYIPSKMVKRNSDKYLDYGIVEKFFEKDEYNRLKMINPLLLAKTDLTRGVVYLDNNGNKKYLGLRNGNYYYNINNKWHLCDKEEVFSKNLKALIITGGIKKFSYFSDLIDVPEITEVHYVSNYCKRTSK